MIPMTGRDDDAGRDRSSSFRTTVCPHCGSRVPDAPFCGACGAHLKHGRGRGAATRIHAHSAFPDEGVLRLAVVSSLFPQLAGASRSAYRVAFGLIVLLLVGLAVAGLTAPVIAVSALAIPLLFLIYLYEIAPLGRTLRRPDGGHIPGRGGARGCLGAAARRRSSPTRWSPGSRHR